MQKMNLSEERSFSDVITAAFSFIRQEFRPLLRSVAVIGGPLLLIDLFFRIFLISKITMPISAIADNAAVLTPIVSKIVEGILNLVAFFWLQLFVMSYLRVYHDKYLQGDESAVTADAVWRRMCISMGKAAVIMVMYFLIVVFGMICLIIPGIYFSVLFLFCTAFVVIRDGGGSDNAMSASARLVRGHWWSIFGSLFILQMITGMGNLLFSIPLAVLISMGELLDYHPGLGIMVFPTLLAQVGQYLVLTILSIGIGVRFFSDQERVEHQSLLNEISDMGNNQPSEKREGEN